MVLAKIHLVDGGYMEIELPDSTLATIARMRREEYNDREIIQHVITDDWGAPPSYVDFVPPREAESIRLDYRS